MISRTKQTDDQALIAAKGTPDLRRRSAEKPWLEILVLSILVIIFIWRAFVPAWRSLNTDFPNYYLTARLYHQHYSLAQVYDWIWFQRQKDHAGMGKRIVGFLPLTLYSAMPALPLTTLSPLAAKRWWLVINLLLLAFTGFLAYQMTALGGVRIAILAFLAIEPLQKHFLYGQFHILVLFLLALSLWLYLKGRTTTSGVVLALASAIKIYPIFFVFYFVRKKQWRATAGLLAGAFLLAGLAIYFFGVEVNRVYLEQVLPRVMKGENIDPYNINWNSFTALFHRLFIFEPELNPHPLVNFPSLYAVLQPLAQALIFVPFLWLLTPRRATANKEKLEYATYIAMLLLLSTNPSSYHYTVLILCAVLAVDSMLCEQRFSQAALFILAYTLVCLPTHRFTQETGWPAALLAFSRLYFLIVLFSLLLVALSSTASMTWSERLKSRSAFVFLPMFLVIVSAGTILNVRHMKGEFENYASRLMVTPESLMMTDPSVSANRILFTLLMPPTYAMGSLAGNRFSFHIFDTDAFHPVLVPGSSQAWVELAGPISRIVRLDLDGSPASNGILPGTVENGEQPVISPDGKWLAFIREVRGHGSLWIKGLQPDEVAALGVERELVGPDFNVLDVAFDAKSLEIMFAAQPHGEPALFKVGLAPTPISQITFGSPARYPAFSPDGCWIAYSKLERGSWHVWLKPSASGAERRLTTGECNSISPAWMPDSKRLIYATDCGRGLGMTALAQIRAVR